MAISRVTGVRLAGVASAVPEEKHHVEELSAVFGEAEVKKISESTGVVERYIVPEGMCTSDLCYAAAEQLLADTGWERDSVDALIFVSQTPDYVLPATACTLQRRLKLSKRCAAFDVGLGCSGYVYGLWLSSALISGGSIRRVLLLVGDTSNKPLSRADRSVAMLFGDAGTASAVERAEGAPAITFVLGTDGGGRDNLIIPAGHFRTPSTTATATRTAREGNNQRSDEDLYMNGAEVFTFTLREVPALLKSLFAESGWEAEGTDAFVFHQANKFMLDYLVKRMKLPAHKVPIIISRYGNTSSASIPLAMTDALGPRLREQSMRLVLGGFGVGYSWGAATIECGPMPMPGLVRVSKSGILAGWEASIA
jgi:3-oxoacyl-[acyl-carrier-protein] synthase-3